VWAGFPKSRPPCFAGCPPVITVHYIHHKCTVLPKLVTVCPYIAIYMALVHSRLTLSFSDWTKETSFINHAYAGLLKIQFPDGGSFACFQGEKNRLLATKTNEASFEPGGDIEIEVDDLAASRVTTCYVSDTKQLNFVDLQETIAVNVAALVAIFVGLRLFTYLSLRFVTLKTR
jgi:hypothetical protein